VKNILEVEGLSKDFIPPLSFGELIKLDLKRGMPARALRDVSFSLEPGKILGVLGPNGAGKTTLLKIIATLILPDKGSVSINGYRLGNDDEKIKSIVGLVCPQERSFYWRLTGRQNLEFFAAMHGLTNVQARLKELFDIFRINYQDKRFDRLSSGMKQKFALIRGLLHDPRLLLLDEPTKSLDYTAALDLRGFIKENMAKKGKTVVFATHNMDEALDFCDLFMILNQGKLRAFGTLEELRGQTGRPGAALGEIFVRLSKT